MAHTVCPTSKRSVMKWHYMAHTVCPTSKRSVMRRHYMARTVCPMTKRKRYEEELYGTHCVSDDQA